MSGCLPVRSRNSRAALQKKSKRTCAPHAANRRQAGSQCVRLCLRCSWLPRQHTHTRTRTHAHTHAFTHARKMLVCAPALVIPGSLASIHTNAHARTHTHSQARRDIDSKPLPWVLLWVDALVCEVPKWVETGHICSSEQEEGTYARVSRKRARMLKWVERGHVCWSEQEEGTYAEVSRKRARMLEWAGRGHVC